MTTDLRAIDPPNLQPLRNSFEYDELESELKDAFMTVFTNLIRPNERQVNLQGMPHLGDTELIERTLKDYGLAIVRRDATRTAFLLQAARARNPRRGMIFLRQYLQSVWPNVWKVEPLWHPIATAASYPTQRSTLGTVDIDSDTVAVFDPSGADDLPTVYKTDWQGRMQMFPTPRTNTLKTSRDLTAAGWDANTFWTKTVETTIPAPDNGANVTKFVLGATTNRLFARQSGLVLPAGQRTASVWLYVPSGQAASWTFSTDYEDTDNGGAFTSNLFDQWVRAESTATLSVQRGTVDFNMLAAGGDPAAGFRFYAICAQEETGPDVTRFIATTAAPAPVTDFTVGANGLAIFVDGTPPAPLTYFLTGRIRVTLPVSIDNGLGLIEIAKAFRSTLAARLMLELQLSTVFENIGESGGIALANASKGVMPFTAIGTLLK